MAPQQRRRGPRGKRPQPAPGLATALTGRRVVLLAIGAIVASVAIGAGLFTVFRTGTSVPSCDPDQSGWNGAGGGPQQLGFASGSIHDPGRGWAPSWSYPPQSAPASERVTAPPAESNGTVYTATDTGSLVALSADRGVKQWSSAPAAGEQGKVGVPIAVDGCGAAVGTSFQSSTGEPAGALRAVDVRSHQRRWGVQVADEVLSAPEIVDGVAYAGLSFAASTGSLDRIHVLDGYYLSDGSNAYRKRFTAAVFASPASDHTRIWIGDLDQNLYALGPKGKQLWTFTSAGIVTLPAMYDGNDVVVASADHTIASLDPGTGRVHWSVSVGDVQAPMAESGGEVLAADVGGTVHALGTGDGRERWHADLGARVSRAVVAAGDRVFVIDDDGVLHVLDVATGKETASWTAPAPATGSPAIAAGHLYVACQNGRLYALPL
jgi:outer membrane protein assembly factor BamB